jgi:hypothetical protein
VRRSRSGTSSSYHTACAKSCAIMLFYTSVYSRILRPAMAPAVPDNRPTERRYCG